MEKRELLSNQEPVYLTYYTINSSLNYGDTSRYCQTIVGSIQMEKEEASSLNPQWITVGRIKAYKILIDIAVENREDIVYVFDTHQETMDIGEALYDFTRADFREKVNKHFDYHTYGSDILILSTIEVLPEYRGKSIGKRAIKDLYNNFISGWGLFALSCFPNQYNAWILGNDDPFTLAMQYDKMGITRPKAFKKLSKYFRSLGFETMPGVSKDIMVYNPVLGNEHFDSIILDQ